MGVDRTDYIIYGWKLPYEMKDKKGKNINYWDEDIFESYLDQDHADNYILIPDQMCGSYTLFGQKIKSGGDEYTGWEYTELSFSEYETTKLKHIFENLFGVKPETEPQLFIMSHFY